MVGPRLTNLRSLRLVNFQPPKIDSSVFAQTFFTLHHEARNEKAGPDSPQNASDTAESDSVDYKDDLLYVSETIGLSHITNFGVVSLPSLPQQTFRVKVRVWLSQGPENTAFHQSYELNLDLRNLVPLEKDLVEDSVNAFTANAIIWQFKNNSYCLQAHISNTYAREGFSSKPSESVKNRRGRDMKLSYSLDDIRHMSSLIVGLRDFDEIKTATSNKIDTLFEQNISHSESLARLTYSISQLEMSIAKQESINDLLESEVLARRNSIKEANQIVSVAFPSYKDLVEEKAEIVESQITPLHDSLDLSIYPEILSYTHHIISQIAQAYPIGLARNSDQHCISGIEFPSSIVDILRVCYNDEPLLRDAAQMSDLEVFPPTHISSVDCINAGLSELVNVMNHLSYVMGVKLKYEMTYAGSKSYLVEHLSPHQVVANNQNTPLAMQVSTRMKFPLHYDIVESEKLADGFVIVDDQKYPRNIRFERGLALLNRNLGFLISEIADLYSQYNADTPSGASLAQNIPSDCSDHFLWNIHYLILFLTAPPT